MRTLTHFIGSILARVGLDVISCEVETREERMGPPRSPQTGSARERRARNASCESSVKAAVASERDPGKTDGGTKVDRGYHVAPSLRRLAVQRALSFVPFLLVSTLTASPVWADCEAYGFYPVITDG